MRRRDVCLIPLASFAAPVRKDTDPLESVIFRRILEGYLRAAARTAPSLAVCEFRDATVTNNFRAKSALSVTAVTRMMPAVAAWIVSGREPQTVDIGTRKMALLDAFAQTCRNAFDPASADYWLPAPPNKSDQRQVESSIVAWSIWLVRDKLLPKLSSLERKQINDWLASCTQAPVRKNNWAWFTAVNQAARISLSSQYPEFRGDAAWMIDDLRALDAMARGNEGWYSDSTTEPMFDYYNSWVFASHFLYWNQIAGSLYPDWSKRFGDRLRKYLMTAPQFFGANGSHVLYGRSLIYRFAVLTPLVLSYTQKLWPHSPGLLRALVQKNMQFFWSNGAYDESRGKLRETMSPAGTPDIRESYIDGGHPYWGMQAFASFLIPSRDPYWSASPDKLPVERADFATPIASAGLLLTGTKASGEVRLYNALSSRSDIHYRDKYNKFVYSTAHPMCIVQSEKVCPWDSALVLRETATGTTVGRGAIESSQVSARGVELTYTLALNAATARVHTRIIVNGSSETRQHSIEMSGPATGYEFVEGSPAMSDPIAVEAVQLSGWTSKNIVSDFGPSTTSASNVLVPDFRVLTLRAPAKPGQTSLSVTWVSTVKNA